MDNKHYIDNVTKEIITQLTEEIGKDLTEKFINIIDNNVKIMLIENDKELIKSFEETNLISNKNILDRISDIEQKIKSNIEDNNKIVLNSIEEFKTDLKDITRQIIKREIEDLIMNTNSSFESYKNAICQEIKNNNNSSLDKIINYITSNSETTINKISDYNNIVESNINKIEDKYNKEYYGAQRTFIVISTFLALLFILCIIIYIKIN